MANKLVSENPYGKIKLDELELFERKLGVHLPDNYRNYLVSFNGGRYGKDVVKISAAEGETRIHHMYGLHAGPEYAQLRSDLIKGEFFAICDDASGNEFLIKVRGVGYGSVYFLNHEENDFKCALTLVSSDFSEFVDRMISVDEQTEEFRTRDPAGYSDFKNRLEEMKRLREAEISRSKDENK